MLAVISIQTPFDPQALYTAFSFISSVFASASWQNMVKMFFMIALINGIISVAIFQKTDYFKQFIVALAFSGILAAPVSDTLAISRSSTERVYTISNSKVPWVLVEGFTVINNVTRWFTNKAGANLNSPAYNGIYDAGIGSYGNIIRNSMDISFKNPTVKANLMQFFKECSIYDIRDGAININSLTESGGGFGLLFSNTSPARFVTVNSTTGNSEVKTCTDAAQQLRNEVNYDTTKTTEEKGKSFFYAKDGAAPSMATAYYQAAIAATYQNQLNINNSMAAIMQQNMFNYLLEQTGQDFSRMLTDPALAENAAIHMATSRAAKKAAFQQSVIAQLGKELLPAMGSWIAIIIIMLFPFVILLFILAPLGNMLQVLFGYLGTLFWICLWQPIFAMINGLANWELGRQLAATGAFGKDGIPYGYVNAVYDSLINNQSLVGWLVLLTPVIASAVAFGTYKSLSSLGSSVMSTFSGTGTSVGNEMAEGNVSMGNSSYGNTSLGNTTRNNTSANKYDTNTAITSGLFKINNAEGTTYTFGQGGYVAQNFDKDETNADIKATDTATSSKGLGNSATSTLNIEESGAINTDKTIKTDNTGGDTYRYVKQQTDGNSLTEHSDKTIQTGTTDNDTFNRGSTANFNKEDANTNAVALGLHEGVNANLGLNVNNGNALGPTGTPAGTPAPAGKNPAGKGNVLSKIANTGKSLIPKGGFVTAGANGTLGQTISGTETGTNSAAAVYNSGDSTNRTIANFDNATVSAGASRQKIQSDTETSSQENSFTTTTSRGELAGYSQKDGASYLDTKTFQSKSDATQSTTVEKITDLSLPENADKPLEWLMTNGHLDKAKEILKNNGFTDKNGNADFEAYRRGGGLAKLEARREAGTAFNDLASEITGHTLNNSSGKPVSRAENYDNFIKEDKKRKDNFDKADKKHNVPSTVRRVINNYGPTGVEMQTDRLISQGKDKQNDLSTQVKTTVGQQVTPYKRPNQQGTSIYNAAGNLRNGDKAQALMDIVRGGDPKKE